jgi:nucleotide-binding universal stress UspA family protein
MLKTILIGLDRWPDSEIALEMTLDWAHHFDAMLVGLGIIDEPAIVATEEPPADVLLAEIRRLNPRLLVMGAYDRPRWREWIFGSNSRALLQTSPVPVLLYH